MPCAIFPIAVDFFGDAYKIRDHLDQTIAEIPAGTNEAFFSISYSPWMGYTWVLSLITYLAYYVGITYGEAFLFFDAICGGLFVFLWLSLVHKYLRSSAWCWIMGLAGITAPFMLNFFGHMEAYAPVFLCSLLLLSQMLFCIQRKGEKAFWGLIPIWLLCIQVHPVALLFLPALGILYFEQFSGENSRIRKGLDWKGIFKWLISPIFFVGAILYFIVFKDHVDPRSLNEKAMEFDRLFLPLFSPAAPLDAYNLLSFNHMFDYFSELLIWSPIGLFVLISILLFYSKKINWGRLEIRVFGLLLILFGSLFFVINPLLSMQMDWDLLAIPAPIFLVFTLVLVRQIEGEELGKKLLSPAIGLALLCLPNFFIHADVNTLSQRYESLAVRIHTSYYEWSSKVLGYGLNLPIYPSRAAYEVRKQRVFDKLKPYAQPGVDFEYARLFNEEGRYYLRQAKDYDKALAYLKQGEYYFPTENLGVMYLMEAHFVRKEFDKAFTYSQKLIQLTYPNEAKAIAIGVHCALEAGLSEKALELSERYVQKWQDNPLIDQVRKDLQQGVSTDSLKLLFANPDS